MELINFSIIFKLFTNKCRCMESSLASTFPEECNKTLRYP
jgi:hypothetical protein